MILPLVVIDLHDECAKTSDYTSIERLKKWEKNHGEIPAGAFGAMRTDWSKRWPDTVKMQNKDANGVAHYPGWSLPAPKYLYEERKITASGHETTDTDPGNSDEQRRLLTGNLHSEHEPLPDRTTDQSRPGPRGWCNRRSQFSKTERRLRFSRAGLCDRAIGGAFAARSVSDLNN
jgi:hypothetical protein